jgi:dTDP-D-glucose 4,6-dehydratase
VELLGYAPRYSVVMGMEETMQWYVEAKKKMGKSPAQVDV